ncbi:transposase [Pseudonocardia sp. T1-2H]|uniref:transposase n=1 Tax=Pseudonocardia sp. T1-2H TaxID=3128899 RepID=UPI004054384D
MVTINIWLRALAAGSGCIGSCSTGSPSTTCLTEGQAQMIPGWPYSFVAALEPGRTSWTALLDAVRLGPADDATTMTADQLRAVVGRLIAAGHWRAGDPHILIVADAGYDITRLAFVVADLPVELLGRIRSDRVLRMPKRPRLPGRTGRPPRHGPQFALNKPATWPEPAHISITETTRYGTATATSWDRLHPRGDPPRLPGRPRRRAARARGHPHPAAGRAPAR